MEQVLRTRYVMITKVLSVTEVIEKTNFKKHDDGSVTNDEVSTGLWSVRISDSSAILLPERPVGIQAGGEVRITIEGK
jgi:hypothetical protein